MIELGTSFNPDENLFQYRFPRSNGNKDRLEGWNNEYYRWWYDEYCYEKSIAGWLEDPKAAFNFLTKWQPQRLASSKLIEAAVCSPNIGVSRLMVEKRPLTRRQFALAIAHPKLSVFDLFDAEGVTEGELEKYKQAQLRNGMILEEVNFAMEEARALVRDRKPYLSIA